MKAVAEMAEARRADAQIAIDNQRFGAIEEFCDLASSYARSASEAAWRGDRLTLRTHLVQLRLTTQNALQVFNSLGKPAGAVE